MFMCMCAHVYMCACLYVCKLRVTAVGRRQESITTAHSDVSLMKLLGLGEKQLLLPQLPFQPPPPPPQQHQLQLQRYEGKGSHPLRTANVLDWR